MVPVVFLAACSAAPPELRHDDTVPDDLRALADETWADFLNAIPARHHCVTAPTLQAAWELDSRAEYQPETAVMAVRVPGTPATLRSELIHEFAHHLEFTCPEQEELRSAFLEAQGFRADTPWFDSGAWETTPSEQYAEAMVELVDGLRSHRGAIQLTDVAIDVVRNWGEGS